LLQAALSDINWRVRCCAIKLGGLTQEQYQAALKDEIDNVRVCASFAFAANQNGLVSEEEPPAMSPS
jgi:hypothetical protein